MTITISDALEARLRARAVQEGQEIEVMAEALLSAALDWEAQGRTEAIESIRRGLEGGVASRVRPASEMRARLADAQP